MLDFGLSQSSDQQKGEPGGENYGHLGWGHLKPSLVETNVAGHLQCDSLTLPTLVRGAYG